MNKLEIIKFVKARSNNNSSIAIDKKENKIILSPNISLDMDTRLTRRNCNVLCIGESSSDNKQNYILPNLLQANCSYVVIDYSGEMQKETEQRFREKGYAIKVINLRQLDDLGPVEGACYNPFHYIRSDADVLSLVDALEKNFLPGRTIFSNSDFFKKVRYALMGALAFYLYKECNPAECTLSNFRKLLEGDGENCPLSKLDKLFHNLYEKEPEHIAVKHYILFRSFPGTDSFAEEVIIDLARNLEAFNNCRVANFSDKDDLQLESIGLKPTIIYITLSIANNTFSKLFLPIFFTQLFDILYHTAETKCERGTLPQHVRVLFDQFGEYGYIPKFIQKISTMRPYNISCDIITCDTSVLKRVYLDEWDVIIGNCDSIVCSGKNRVNLDCFVQNIEYLFLNDKKIKQQLIKNCPARINKNVRTLKSLEELKKLCADEYFVHIRSFIPFIDKCRAKEIIEGEQEV